MVNYSQSCLIIDKKVIMVIYKITMKKLLNH